MKRLSAIFLQGLVALLPLAITALVSFWLGSAAERTFGPEMRWFLPDGWYIPGMGVVAGMLLTLVLGLLVKPWGVPQLIRLGEGLTGTNSAGENDLWRCARPAGFLREVRRGSAR